MYLSPDIGSNNPLMPIDTLAISKRLQASGMPQKQAEAQAEVLGEIITQNLASKADVESLRKDTTKAIEDSRKETTTAIENLRKETTTAIENLRKETTTVVENLRKDTKTDIENLRKELLIEIGHIKYDIMKLIIPLMVGQLIAAAGLMKVFIH